jgi:ribosomal protein S27AE
MNCKKPWTREHQNQILKPTFVNKDLKTHLEKVLFDGERSQMVATMEIVEERRFDATIKQDLTLTLSKFKYISSKCNYLKLQLTELEKVKKSPNGFHHSCVNVEDEEQIKSELEESEKIRTIVLEKYRFLERLQRYDIANPNNKTILHHLYESYIPGNPGHNEANWRGAMSELNPMSNNEQKKAKARFVRACPIEECRGFLSTAWKCGLCNVHTCSKCHVPKINKDEEHTCNPDDVATAELLAKDTKPCPKCGTGIFKIEGCNQMYCTECHTAFSWATGELETGFIHNPHYFEYRRRMGNLERNPLDMQCGNLTPAAFHGITYAIIRRTFPSANEIPKQLADDMQKLTNFIQLAADGISVYNALMVQKYRPDAILDNTELRFRYLTNEIDEPKFKSLLFKDTKKFKKEREIGQILQTVVLVLMDIMTRITTYINDNRKNLKVYAQHEVEELKKIVLEINNIHNYANECFANI